MEITKKKKKERKKKKKKVIMHRPNIAFVVPVFRYISTVTELERGKQAHRKCKNSIFKNGTKL